MKIVILTGAELRHTFMRKAIALDADIEVLKSYCEGTEKSLMNVVRDREADPGRLRHLEAREQSEKDFFEAFTALTPDLSNPCMIEKGSINRPEHVEAITALEPDLIVAYGCSIIREPLVSRFEGRFLNVHLGLSPYYRGSGTNFWPLVNSEPEYVGATFMYLDRGVDTGEIIHQIRARVCSGDTPHQIGNRLIADVAREYIRLINRFDRLKSMPRPPKPLHERYYRNSDFTPEAVETLYENFRGGMVEAYLQCPEADKAPIVENPALGRERP